MVIGGVDGGTGRFCWAGAYFHCFILCRDDKNDGCQVYGKYRANYKKFVDVATDVCAMILCLSCDFIIVCASVMFIFVFIFCAVLFCCRFVVCQDEISASFSPQGTPICEPCQKAHNVYYV